MHLGDFTRWKVLAVVPWFGTSDVRFRARINHWASTASLCSQSRTAKCSKCSVYALPLRSENCLQARPRAIDAASHCQNASSFLSEWVASADSFRPTKYRSPFDETSLYFLSRIAL